MCSSGGVFDYDHAVVRLAELNARAEDPALWNDQKEAQTVMRERTRLEGAIGTIKRLRAAIDDNVGLIEMAEAEKDEVEDRRRREGAGRGPGEGQGTARDAAVGRGRRQQRLYRDQCRCRRYRGARTGRRCWRACTRAGPSAAASR